MSPRQKTVDKILEIVTTVGAFGLMVVAIGDKDWPRATFWLLLAFFIQQDSRRP